MSEESDIRKFYKIVTRRERLAYLVGVINFLILLSVKGSDWFPFVGGLVTSLCVFLVLPKIRQHGN